MFKQVRANIYFEKEDEAEDFYHDCELALAKGAVINPEQANEEFSIIELIDNNHDINPNEPCALESSANNKPEH